MMSWSVLTTVGERGNSIIEIKGTVSRKKLAVAQYNTPIKCMPIFQMSPKIIFLNRALNYTASTVKPPQTFIVEMRW
jgi:hypothetical protein